MICKSYDAHNCWYMDAFDETCSASMIPFNTDRLLWLEKTYGLISKRFALFPDWEELYTALRLYDRNSSEVLPDMEDPLEFRRLSFKRAGRRITCSCPPISAPAGKGILSCFRSGSAFPASTWQFRIRSGPF